jgi:signal transduction histidine kinase
VQRARLFAAVEESRNHLRELLERLQEGLLAVDPALVVEFANPEAMRMLANGFAVGSPLPELWEDFELGGFARELFRGGAPPDEVRFRTLDGRAYEIAGVPGPDSAVIVLRDVSRRERHERAEREFVANAAHELRSPLAGIVAAVDALQLGAKDDLFEREHLLAGIRDESERLTRLVRALLVLARAQADPESLTAHPVEIAPIVNEIARTLDVRPAVRVDVSPGEASCSVRAERVLVESALQNVARNASKHTERGLITLGWNEADGQVTLEVRDTGSGMPPEVRERAFDRFYRGGDPDRRGFGLGLPLVREMVRILGGDVSIDSSVDVGTTVRLTLPAA